MAYRKARPPKNRRKTARYRAAKKSRVKRRKAKSPHGQKTPKSLRKWVW